MKSWSGFWGEKSNFVAEFGRSMIEMLGVLAIVGVLSIGGISGFQKAMNKHKINLVTEELFQFINELLRYSKDWRRVYDQHPGTVTEITSKLDFLVSGKWRRNGRLIYDSMGNEIVVAVRQEGGRSLSVRYGMTGLSNENAVNLCLALYEMAKPYADMVFMAIAHQQYADATPTQTLYLYGNAYCDGRNKKCLRDLTVAEMLEKCSLYRDGDGAYRSFVIFFPL